MGQVSTFTIGDLVVPVVVEAYRANWFPTEDGAKTSSHKVVMQSFDQDRQAGPAFLSALLRLHTHKLRAVIFPDPCCRRDYPDRSIFIVFRGPRPLPRVLDSGGFEVTRLGLQNGGSRGEIIHTRP
jgi:hypothetical protein